MAECADLCAMAQVLDAVPAGLKVPGDFFAQVIAEARAVAGNAALPALEETSAPMLTVVSRGCTDLEKGLRTELGWRGHRVCHAGSVLTLVTTGGELGIEPAATSTPASMGVCRR